MRIGDLSQARTLRERRDCAAFQALRVLLVIGLMAGGSLALWLSGSSTPSAEGIVTAAPPQTLPREQQIADRPVRTAQIQVADAGSAVPVPAPTPPAPVVDLPASGAKDTARAPTAESPVPLTSDQASAALEQAEAALDQPAQPVPAPPTDMDMTGTVMQHASLAAPAAPESPAATLVDLNKASFEELNSIKGAGALGRAIIKGRPYKSVDDLVKRKILRRTIYEKIKDQVTVQ